MNRRLVVISLVTLGATAAIVTLLSWTPKTQPLSFVELQGSIFQATAGQRAEAQALTKEVQQLTANLKASQDSVRRVSNERTPLPSGGLFGGVGLQAVRAADAARSAQLGAIERQLGLMGQQLRDLQQRTEAMDTRLQDASRDITERIRNLESFRPKESSGREATVSVIGILISFCTLLIAFRKDLREERAVKRPSQQGEDDDAS